MTFQRGIGPSWLTPELRAALAARRAAIAAHYAAARSLAVTAKVFGISRQRVWMIVKAERLRVA